MSPDADRHLDDQPGNALGLTDQVEALLRRCRRIVDELVHVAIGQHSAAGDHVVAEGAIFVGPKPDTALGQPTTNGRRWRTGKVRAQGQALLVEHLLQFLPDYTGLYRDRHGVGIYVQDLVHPGEIDNQPPLDRQGGCPLWVFYRVEI